MMMSLPGQLALGNLALGGQQDYRGQFMAHCVMAVAAIARTPGIQNRVSEAVQGWKCGWRNIRHAPQSRLSIGSSRA